MGIPESLHASFAARRPEAMWVLYPRPRREGWLSKVWAKFGNSFPKRRPWPSDRVWVHEGETHSLVRKPFPFRGPGRFGCRCPASGNPKRCSEPRTVCLDPACRGMPHPPRADPRSTCLRPEAFSCSRVLIRNRSKDHHYSFVGSSLLARGGSGDLLTGILGAPFAKNIDAPTSASWVLGGRAAEVLARQNGQEAVYATDLLDFLSFAIRNDF